MATKLVGMFSTRSTYQLAFGCWRSGISERWRADIGRELTAEESAAVKRKAAVDQQRQQAEKKKNQARARERAAKIWEGAPEAPAGHPYLVKKGVGPHGLRIDINGRLIVRLFDTSGALQSIQWIDDGGNKGYLFGGRVSGCYFIIGKPKGVLGVCEGFATGAAVLEDTGHAVAIAFSAGNLPATAMELRGKFSDLGFIVCADDDAHLPNNPGLKYTATEDELDDDAEIARLAKLRTGWAPQLY